MTDSFRPLDLPGEPTRVEYPEAYACQLEHLARRYSESGDGELLLEGILLAATLPIPAPQWCIRGLFAAILSWSSGEAKEFGDAIGIKRPKGWRQVDHQRRQGFVNGLQRNLAVYAAVERDAEQGCVLNLEPSGQQESAFRTVADEFNISPKTVEKWYYSTRRKLKMAAETYAQANQENPPTGSAGEKLKKLHQGFRGKSEDDANSEKALINEFLESLIRGMAGHSSHNSNSI